MTTNGAGEAITATTRFRTKSVRAPRTTPWARISVAIGALATAGSLVSLVFEDAVYGRETAEWAAQSVGQDIANLLAFPALVVAALLADRGSVRAHVVWIGLLVYSAYTYAIYAFALHFGPLFLLWVAVFGLSVYALIGSFVTLDARSVVPASDGGTVERPAARVLVGIGVAFALLWLSEIVPAIASGATPEALKDVGLLTNPVHVLDLGLLLPALVIGGVLLKRRHPLGYVLAPALLVATFFLGIGIVSLMSVSAARGLEASLGVGTAIAVLLVVEATVAFRLLRRRFVSES